MTRAATTVSPKASAKSTVGQRHGAFATSPSTPRLADGATAPEGSDAADSLGSRSIMRDLAMVGSGTLASHALGVITGLLMRALLEPRMMGIWSLLKLLLSYGNYAGLGVSKGAAREIAVQQGRGCVEQARRAANLAYTFNTLTSAAYMVAVLTAAAWVYATSTGPLAGFWSIGLAVIGVSAMLQRYATFGVTVLRARRRFDITTKLTVVEACLTLVVTAVAIWLLGLYGLLAGHVMILLSSIAFLRSQHAARFTFCWDWLEIRRLLAVGAPILLGGAMFSLLQSLDRLMIASYLADPEFHLGCYSLATMVSAQLFGLGNVVGIVMNPRYQEHFGRTGSAAPVAGVARRALVRTLLGLGALFAVTALVAPPLLGLLFPDYRPGVPAIVALLPGTLCLAVSLPVTHYCVAVNRQRRPLGASVAGLAVGAAANHLVLTSGGGITSVAWATSASYGVYLVLLVISAPGLFAREGSSRAPSKLGG